MIVKFKIKIGRAKERRYKPRMVKDFPIINSIN